jgi:hypothetical protein
MADTDEIPTSIKALVLFMVLALVANLLYFIENTTLF